MEKRKGNEVSRRLQGRTYVTSNVPPTGKTKQIRDKWGHRLRVTTDNYGHSNRGSLTSAYLPSSLPAKNPCQKMPPRNLVAFALIVWIVAFLSHLSADTALIEPSAAQRWSPEGPGGKPSFAKHVVPLLNKQGCSTRDCHGSFQGQKGFRLSLFGYDLELDYAELTADNDEKEEPRPRVVPGDPKNSLALIKPLDGELAHKGGARLEDGTWQYRLFREWIAEGAPFDSETEPYLKRLELIPEQIRFTKDSKPVPLRSIAYFSDGSAEEVTALTSFSSNDAGTAEVTDSGMVTKKGIGDTDIVATYGSAVVTTQVLIPNVAGLESFPRFTANSPVDDLVAAKLRQLGVHPSGLSTDSQFLRRAFVDAIGTLPTAEEARQFLADDRPDKRERLIEELLNRHEYALYWATIWSDWTGNSGGVLNPNYKVSWLWHDWFVDKFSRNVSYDQLVRGIIVASSLEGRTLDEYLEENKAVSARISPYVGAPKHTYDDGTYGKRKTLDLYWMKRDGSPEKMSINSASTLLGIQINCAQCHKHPFDRWTQEDFETYTSFFRVMDVRSLDGGERPNRRDIDKVAVYPGYYRQQPGQVMKYPPKILGGDVVGYEEGGADPREKLWNWMVHPENPYFARSIVNRIWGHYFGVGIVDPIDDFNAANPPSNAGLLDWLAKDLIAHEFDLKHLHRRILSSRVYQLSHLPNDTNRHDRRNYSHALVKRMSAEVMFDAICQVSGTSQAYSTTFVPPGTKMIGMGATRLGRPEPEYAMRIFGRPKRQQSCACERSNEAGLTQALYLLNDADLLEKVADPEGRAARLASAELEDAVLIEELYLTILSRYPEPEETEKVSAYLQATQTNRTEAIQDVMWSLMNVREFLFVR